MAKPQPVSRNCALHFGEIREQKSPSCSLLVARGSLTQTYWRSLTAVAVGVTA
jgi:hypothetical protein